MTARLHLDYELPEYRSIKHVRGTKIRAVGEIEPGKGVLITPDEPGCPPFYMDVAYAKKHQPKVGGYLVVYEDGYVSYSPAKAFEEGYVRLTWPAATLEIKEG